MALSRLIGSAAILALSGPLAGAADSTLPGIHEDVLGTCTSFNLQLECKLNETMPVERGICVLSGETPTCRDVCNVKWSPKQYVVGTNRSVNDAVAGSVEMVRTGKNFAVKCPGLTVANPCELREVGELCPTTLAKQKNIPFGRGICVVGTVEKECSDMCDLEKEPASYAEGGKAGVVTMVNQVRAGYACPGRQWLPWFFGGMVVLSVAVCGCCFLFVTRKTKGRAAASRAYSSRDSDRVPEMDYGQDFGNMHEPMVSSREMPPSQRERQQQMEDMRAQQEYEMQQQQQQQQYQQQYPPQGPPQDTLPPEPPRQAQQMLQPPPMQQTSEYGSMPVGMSTKIPGLDEPNIYNSLVMTQGSAQGPALVSSTSQAVPQYSTMSMAAPSYSTQVPAYLAGGSPPASLQMAPGVLQSTQGGQFFTTIARR